MKYYLVSCVIAAALALVGACSINYYIQHPEATPEMVGP